MSHRWQLLALPVLLAVALTVRAAPGDSDTLKQTDSQKIEEILRQMQALKTTVENLDKLREDLKKLEGKEERHNDTISTRIDELKGSIGGLEGRIKQMESTIEAMRAQTSTSNRISGYAGAGTGAPPPPPMGTIRLHNTFPDQVSVVVNGQSYQLLPGDTQVLQNQPAGPFTYEVLGIQAPKTLNLAPNERFTITVFAR
jgi:outer membrane murein-binding lipoprotein Lpp